MPIRDMTNIPPRPVVTPRGGTLPFAYLRVQRPTFAQFEGLAVTGGLDAFDSAMRARQQGVAGVTERDVAINAKAAVSALEEVCYVLGKDKTYEEMKERMTPPVVATSGGVLEERRDYLAEEDMIVGDANRFEGQAP